MLKRMTIITLFCLWLPNFAYATIGYSHVALTNNTPQPIKVDVQLETPGLSLTKGNDWDGVAQTIAPFETKEVLWFSRSTDLEPMHLYHYIIKTMANGDNESPILTHFYVKGNLVFGSEIKAELQLPGELPKSICNSDGLERISADLWSHRIKNIYVRNALPLGEIYNSYHLVLNQEDYIFEAKTKNEISVLTYNTQLMPFYAGVVDDLNQPNVRVDLIPKVISQYDVVVLEELFDHDLRNKTIARMSENYPYHTSVLGAGTTNLLTGGVVIFSKWPIVTTHEYIFRARTGIDQFAQKGAIYVALNKDGRIYHVIGTHLQAGSNADVVRVRMQQLQELNQFVLSLNIPSNEPLLFTGDFNINEFSQEAQTLYSMLNVNLVENLGLKYSFDAQLDTMVVGKERARLDYVFSSQNHLKPITAYNKVFILRALDTEKMWPKFDLSDHFPVSSYFKFSEQ